MHRLISLTQKKTPRLWIAIIGIVLVILLVAIAAHAQPATINDVRL